MFVKKKSVLLFLLPGLVGLLMFYVVPFFGGLYYSFTDGSYKNAFVGFDNYINVLNNSIFQTGLKNTFELSLICMPLVWLLSFLIALSLTRLKRGGNFFRNSVLLPYVMPSSAILLIWLLLFDYGGVINRIWVALFGFRVNFLEGSAMRFPVILMFVWKNLGFAVIIFLSAMQTVPAPLYEYAVLEGASFLRIAWSVTLPQILPTGFLVMILEWVNAFKIFKEIYFIGGAYPGYEMYTLQNYMNNMYSNLNYQNVTTAAYIFAVIVFALFGLLFLVQNRTMKSLEGGNEA